MQEDVKAFTREQRSPESSAHHHTKGGSCLCSPPVTATRRWFSNEVTTVWFRHPLPKAMPRARHPHCPPPPDGCWMQRGHHISCSFLVPVALPPPQSRVTLLDLAPATHGNALHAEWNETRRTQRKAEQVPDGRCTAVMYYQSYSSDLHTGAQTACTAARTTAQHTNTCLAHQHLPKQALSFLWWAFLSFFSRLTCPYL